MDATIPLTGLNLASAQSLGNDRSYMCNAAQRELQIIHYKATQWITWWQVSEVHVWTLWRCKVAHLIHWQGAELRREHRNALEGVLFEAAWAMNPTYHSDAHDCIVLTGPRI